VENRRGETSVPLYGSKMASYVPLFFFFRSPLSNLPFLLTFIKIRCNFRTYKPNPRDNWAGLMWVSCDTTRA
jgi:hypothetical protein